jgi:hypothetical protein
VSRVAPLLHGCQGGRRCLPRELYAPERADQTTGNEGAVDVAAGCPPSLGSTSATFSRLNARNPRKS